MNSIASMAILMSLSSVALAQENTVRSVTPDRLGTWAPRDAYGCEAIYGDGHRLCLADRYHLDQERQARAGEAALERAQTENFEAAKPVIAT